jgi:glycosyltransferase involved in cell wall biosynthesis
VSAKLAEYVRGAAGENLDVFVVPSCVDASFFETDDSAVAVRRDLAVEGRPILVYAGSVTAWNLVEPMLDLFAAVRESRLDAHLLFLTTAQDEARLAIEARGWPERDYTVATVPHDRVRHYLSCGDLALLLRDNHIVNRVASPVKLGEYLACGVPVCVTPHVGDVSEMVAAKRVGVVVDPRGQEPYRRVAAFLSSVLADRSGFRERCRALARARYARDTYMDLYQRLAREE